MTTRRNTDPFIAQCIWNGICYNNFQNKIVDLSTLTNFLELKIKCSESQANAYIKQMMEDNLLIEEGDSPTLYKKPKEIERPPDDHDWYCIECHRAGNVLHCQECNRVYHLKCISQAKRRFREYSLNQKTFENINADELFDAALCCTCNLMQLDIDKLSDIGELNHLLSFIFERIRSWLPLNLSNTLSEDYQPEWMTAEELNNRSLILFHKFVDYTVIHDKICNNLYTRLFEFTKDVEVMHHNVGVFHGVDSQEFGAAELMMKDCIHDVKEVINCVDCYKYSNEKAHSKWFCIPCRIPHKLVWAKQKGYPYWPAKVIQETALGIDVRFFGGKYERSVLPRNSIKPIDVDMTKLQIKESTSFNKAVQELKLHQKYLKHPELIPKPLKNVKVVAALNQKKTLENSSYRVNVNHDLAPDIKPAPESTKRKYNDMENESPTLTEQISDSGKPSEKKHIYEELANCDKQNDTNYRAQAASPQYCDAVEKMRKKLEYCKDKQTLINVAMDCMEQEIERLKNENKESVKHLTESFTAQINETKKKQWCYNCGQDALYHCCWNTAYCSQTCQQHHWQSEHKRVCRRKRN